MLYIALSVFALGLIIGSFLNVVIYRLRIGQSLMGRSFCTKCQVRIAWYDNIPIISYIILGGRCRKCRESISWYYPAVEGSTALLYLLAYFALEPVLTAHTMMVLLTQFVFIAILVVIFVYDLKWYLILDVVTIPAMIFAFITNVYLGHIWWNVIAAGALGGGFFLLQYLVSGGKWIGGGDVRLGALMGLMLGYPMILVALMLAYLIGSAISLPLVFIGKRQMGDKIPFGTFLSVATIITLLYGESLLRWYLSLF